MVKIIPHCETDGSEDASVRTRRALIMLGPRDATLRDEPLADLRPNQVMVRSLVSSFKHGTEISAYLGTNVFATKRLDRKWRVFAEQPAEGVPAPCPRQLGNMTVGEIEACGSDVASFSVGERVFGWLPVADRHVCDAASVRPLGGLTPEQALCIDPASFGLGAVLDGEIRSGEKVLITGLGAIGLMAVQYCKLRGAIVYTASGFARRRELAVRYGADFVFDRREGDDLGLKVKQMTDGGVEAALECSGIYSHLHQAVRATRQCGRVVCAGFYSGGACDLRLGEEFFHNRITLLASLPALAWNNPVRSDPPLYAHDLQQLVADDFRTGRLSAAGLLQPSLPFAESVQAIETICSRPEEVVKVLITY
jgi:threonine dehydrogenase-like Zn-dependent dehydrogenase